MNSVNPHTYSETEARIIEAAIGVFLRYGAKKTTMADIARAAEVSRQTVYTAFGDKDGIIVACINHVTDLSLAGVQARLETAQSLEECLDGFFAETVVKSFELLETAGNAEELISEHNKAGQAAIEEAHGRQEILMTEILAPHASEIEKNGQTVLQLAHFCITTAMAFKYAANSRADLDQLLSSLKRSILLIAKGAQ